MSNQSELEIKSADFYSFHKQRYYNLHLFTYRVLAFSQFPVGTYKNADSQPPQGRHESLRFNNSPAAS